MPQKDIKQDTREIHLLKKLSLEETVEQLNQDVANTVDLVSRAQREVWNRHKLTKSLEASIRASILEALVVLVKTTYSDPEDSFTTRAFKEADLSGTIKAFEAVLDLIDDLKASPEENIDVESSGSYYNS